MKVNLNRPTRSEMCVDLHRLVRPLFSFGKCSKFFTNLFRHFRVSHNSFSVKRVIRNFWLLMSFCYLFVFSNLTSEAFDFTAPQVSGERFNIGILDSSRANQNGIENVSGNIEFLSLISPEIESKSDPNPQEQTQENNPRANDWSLNVVIYILLQLLAVGLFIITLIVFFEVKDYLKFRRIMKKIQARIDDVSQANVKVDTRDLSRCVPRLVGQVDFQQVSVNTNEFGTNLSFWKSGESHPELSIPLYPELGQAIFVGLKGYVKKHYPKMFQQEYLHCADSTEPKKPSLFCGVFDSGKEKILRFWERVKAPCPANAHQSQSEQCK